MQYRHRHSEQEFIVLHEPETASRRRYWGTYVLRLGAADAYLIQVPRPLYEVNSFEYAVSLFERLNARALLISCAHPDANRDGSADLVRQETSVPCPWSRKGTVMRKLIVGSDSSQRQLIDGVRIMEDDGWVLLTPETPRI